MDWRPDRDRCPDIQGAWIPGQLRDRRGHDEPAPLERCGTYCGCTPALRKSFSHCGTCCFTWASRASGFALSVMTVAPRSLMLLRNLSFFMAACREVTSLSTTGCGVS